ncbi:uncharacterized protein LOC100120687 isoform X5 [Nasonia vitripennis]|uniref:dTCF n=1 Tax=Nasonia vitripennis TaxID=7425 RepID=A0A7M7QF89_NASVI|nr:uncharacterized protein LOC100120687 isoform X5 [Nasonia vitripennis]
MAPSWQQSPAGGLLPPEPSSPAAARGCCELESGSGGGRSDGRCAASSRLRMRLGDAAEDNEDGPEAAAADRRGKKVHRRSRAAAAREEDAEAQDLSRAEEAPGQLADGYDEARVYLAHVLCLDWRRLPGRRAEGPGERVWLLAAADRLGRHRTRLLVVGRHWRPRCLEHVNMLSQPVVYAGGGRGALSPELFLWWFRHEFAPAALALHPEGALLVAPRSERLPADGLEEGRARLLLVPADSLDPRPVADELRARLAAALLGGALVEARMRPGERGGSLDDYLAGVSLKEAFAELHRAWLAVRPESFGRCWTRPRAEGRDEREPALAAELRSLSLEAAGLRIDDEDVRRWLSAEEAEREMKSEPEELARQAEAEEPAPPEAREVVGLLSRVLRWMETEPLEPGFLLAVRAMRATAILVASKMGLTGTHPSGLPFFCSNGEHLTQPPPAHMGIPPYGALDAGKAAAAAGEYWPAGHHHHHHHNHHHPSHPTWKQLLSAAASSSGLTRAPMYPFSTGQYPYPMLSPEMTQVAASWHTPSMYPISPASAGFRSPYPTSLPISSSSLPSDLYRFSPTGLMPPHPGLSPHAHALASHALVSSAPKADHSSLDHNHRSTIEQKNSSSLPADNTKNQDTGQQNNQDKKKPHIKKPLNAFMLYMKEMRAKVVAECTLKESAAINQILGRRWHALGRDEQAKYYEMARRERQLHMQLYPDWSSRANTNRTKKRKRKQDTNSDPGGNNMKKCRARFGLDQQSQWCKPCSPVEHGAGMGIHASIIHHGVGSSAGGGAGGGAGVGGGGGPNSQAQPANAAAPVPQNPNTASNASSPQQEPTYVNL